MCHDILLAFIITRSSKGDLLLVIFTSDIFRRLRRSHEIRLVLLAVSVVCIAQRRTQEGVARRPLRIASSSLRN